MIDRKEREEAVRARTNAVVTAGAGTGKTTILIDTVLSRLLDDGTDVRRILMLTFTEKAANEMKIRLRDALEKKRPGERAEKALAGLDRAQIGTIHAFCAHLLREFPVEAGVDPRFVVDEGQRFREVFEREWERWLEGELAADSPRRDTWLRLLSGATLEEIRAVAEGLCSFDVPDRALDPAAAREEGRRRLARVREEVAAELDGIAARCGKPGNRLLGQMQDAARYLRRGGDGAFLEKNASSESRGWLPEDFETASTVLADARALARDVAAMDEARVGEAAAILCEFARRFRSAYAAEGFVSFDGLLTLADGLLASATFPSICARVRERFDFILVDEFQDTDPVQCDLILRLAKDAKGRLVPGRLFIVGDPKQSIYSFRGADIVAYERVKREMIAAGAREFILRTNFRSHAGILDVVNAVFAQILRPRAELQPAYEPIEPEPGRAKPEGPSVEMVLFEKEERRISSEESRLAEADHVARWIGTNTRRFGDVAILLKALTDAHIYLEALREQGIPYVVEGEKFFYGAPEVVDFANLLQAVEDPNDALALAGLLRSPFGAVDDRQLYELKQAGTLDYRAEPADARLARLYRELRRLHERAGRARVADLIDEIFATTFVLELAAAGYAGEQAVANLRKVREKARELAPPNLHAFIRFMKESIREMEEEGESPLADETLDAVRVMSIHKSKGLEFPIVILPDLHREAQGRRDEPAVRYDWATGALGVRLGPRVDAGAAALAYAESQRRREEEKRVPYVALTRARERLLMLGSGRFSGASLLGMFERAIVAAGGPSIESHSLRTVNLGRASFELHRELWREPERRERPKAAAKTPAKEDWASLAAVWRRREGEYERALASPRFTSPSRLQERSAALLGLDERELAAAAEVGTLCHRALERMDFRKPRADVDGDGAEAEEARTVLKSFLKSGAFAELKRAKIVARELPFVMKREGVILNGVIDVVYRVGRALWVADYKTDRDEHPEQYGEQKRAYLEAVERILGEKPAGFKLIYLRSGRIVESRIAGRE